MKKIWNKVMAVVMLTLGLVLASCGDTPDTIDQLELNRCLMPLNFSATVANGRNVTFKWDVMQGAEQFVLEIYTDANLSGTPYKTIVVNAADVPYTTALETDMTYYARVKAQSGTTQVADSKWAVYTKKIATYELKDALYPAVEARTATSVTVNWDTSYADATDLSRVEYEAVPAAADATPTIHTLTAAEINAGKVLLDGLSASTQYLFTLYFKSASRGSVAAWTMPDLSDATSVSTVAALKQALTDGAAKIVIAYNGGTPYDLDAFVKLAKPVALYGEQTATGKKPVILGNFEMETGATSFHAEGLAFGQRDAAGTDDMTLLRLGALETISAIELVNCEIYGYAKGIFYDNSKAATVNRFYFSSLLIHDIGDGQDTFDMRKGVYGSFTLENSTLYNGCRTVVRGDSATTFSGDIAVKNNFFYKVSGSANGNNCGILSVRGSGTSNVTGSVILSNNIFVEMTGGSTKSGIVGTNSDTYIPATIANNHYYNCTMAAWNTMVNAASAVAGGGSILTSDPCVKSAVLNFTLANDVLVGKQAGDPRWWANAGPVIPEQLVALTAGHVWDFTNAAYYAAGDISGTSVYGNLMFGVTSKPITISSKGVIRFNSASSLDFEGTPSDGYLAFRVSGPGSVILHPILSDNGTVNNCINVIVNKKACGSAFAGSASDLKQKIVLRDLPTNEETTIYLAATGAVDLDYLEWSTDVSFTPVAVQLTTPTLALSSKSETNGTSKALTISWNAADHANGYKLTFGTFETTLPSTTLSYTFTAAQMAALTVGDYGVSLIALAEPSDTRYKDSEAATDTFKIEFLGDGSAVTMEYPSLGYFTMLNTADKVTYWEVTKNADANKVTDTAIPTTGSFYTPAVKAGKVIDHIDITATASMTKKGWLYAKYDAKSGYSVKCSTEFALNNTTAVTVTPTAEYARLYIAASTGGNMKITKVTVYYKDATAN